jgi:hypothetical protein
MRQESKMILLEGGNIFKNAEEQEITRRIDQAEVPGTIKFLEGITGLDFTKDLGEDGYPVKWLGTTGRKASSGDLDLSVNESEINKEQLVHTLMAWCLKNGVAKDDVLNKAKSKTFAGKRDGWIQLTGNSVHFRTPIIGDPSKGFVQTDFMFSPNPQYQQWAMRGGKTGSKFAGAHRHQLLAGLAKAVNPNWMYSPTQGLVDRTTKEVLTNDPNKMAKMLLGNGANMNDIAHVDSILEKLKGHHEFDRLTQEFKSTLERDPSGPQLESVNMELGSPHWFRHMMNKFS